ncbi:MAG: dTDP-4-dehydrorhamnose reductase [Chloroflexota bacterium]|nr:MAG: dTDP-4-dehydrorhamnose reductase [Chloroflexota bacterium]
MRVVITGAAGQLATQVIQFLEQGHEVIPFTRAQLDITDLAAATTIALLEPDLIIHAAAMTNVDGCALDPDASFRVNALGTRNVALGAQRCGARLLYVSTNEVFDGLGEEPYWEFDQPGPLNVYGRSKLAGERFVQQLVSRSYVVRTSWLFGGDKPHFVSKVLRLVDENRVLRMVSDEIASPTYAPDLAQAIVALIQTDAYGVYHLVNDGGCSRLEFAQALLTMAGRSDVELVPISLAEFKRASTPPHYSVLRNFAGAQLGVVLRPWPDALADYFRRVR